MIPFDPCLPVVLPYTRFPRWDAKKEDSMSWRQNQQTSSIYRLFGNNVDYCEDTINVKTAKTLRVKNQKDACPVNVKHATSIYWCGLWGIVYFVVRYCQIDAISSSRLFYRLWYYTVIYYLYTKCYLDIKEKYNQTHVCLWSLLLCGIRAANTIAIYQVSLKSTFN